jgi:glutamate dehydrogenase
LIATEVTNSLIDSLGLTFIHRTCLRNAVKPTAVVRCALVARALLSDPELRIALWDIDAPGKAHQMLAIRQEIVSASQDLTSWLISIFGDQLTLQETLTLFSSDFENFEKLMPSVFTADHLAPYCERLSYFKSLNFSEALAGKFARLPLVMDFIQVSECVRGSAVTHAEAARVFFAAKQALQLDSLAQSTLSVQTQNRWENELVIKCRDELNLCLLRVVEQLINNNVPEERVSSTIQSCSSFNQLMILLDDLGAAGHTPASLAAVSRQLLNFRIAD